MNQIIDFKYQPSPKQQKQLHCLLRIINSCDTSNIRLLVVGGYGLDALYGRLTRDHNDFDLFVYEQSKAKFITIIQNIGFSPTDELVGEVGKSVYVNNNFSPELRLEFGTIEQGMQLIKKLDLKINLSFSIPATPFGVLSGQPILTPTLDQFKKLIEINNYLAIQNNQIKYPHQKWQQKILQALEQKLQ